MATANLPKNATKLSNKTKDYVAQCKVVAYVWDDSELKGTTVTHTTGSSGSVTPQFLDATPNNLLAKATPLDISSQVTNVRFSKTNSKPNGSFEISLSNSPGIGSGDWKDILKRGMWLLIKMTNEGNLALNPQVGPPVKGVLKNPNGEAKYIRCIGYIDRVAVVTSKQENGALDVSYKVTGRDFGVVYSDTTIWHNFFYSEKIVLQDINETKLAVLGEDNKSTKINEVLDILHDLFYNPSAINGSQVQPNDALTQIALQWLLPDALLTDLGFNNLKNTYWGALPGIKNFSTTAASKAVSSPLDFLTGNAWQQLRRLTVPELHELFCETTDDGKPQIIFRPIPFAIDKKDYPNVGRHVTKYRDLDSIEFPTDPKNLITFVPSNAVLVEGVDLLKLDLGEDETNRYNSFLFTIATSLIQMENNIAYLQNSKFPYHVQDSIKRHGFRPMHISADCAITQLEANNGATDAVLAKEFNELLLDYWSRAIYSESGSVTLLGRNDTKIGKILLFEADVPYAYGRRYYIEGYTDTFSVGDKGETFWEQTIQVTNGYEEKDLKELTDFGKREVRFEQEGEYTPARNV